MLQNLYPIALLACPIGMGAMMWIMMRGDKSKGTGPSGNDREIAELKAKVDRLSQAAEGQQPAQRE